MADGARLGHGARDPDRLLALDQGIPGGLVAVIGMIAASWIFDFAAHDISILGPVPSGLPHIGFPQGVSLGRRRRRCSRRRPRSSSSSSPRAPRRRAPTPSSTASRSTRAPISSGSALANLAAGLSGTFVVNGSPTKTEMVDEAQEPHAGRAADHRGDGRDRAPLPDEAAAVSAERGARLGRLPDRRQAGRRRAACGRSCACAWTSSSSPLITAVVVVVVGVEQGIILAIVLSLLLHVKRHYDPADSVLAWDGARKRPSREPRRRGGQ